MTIYQRMESVFQAAGIPGYHLAWRATEDERAIPATYAIYAVSEGEVYYGDDEPQFQRYQVSIWLFTPSDPSPLVAALKAQMADERWTHRPVEEGYEPIPGGRHEYRKMLSVTFDSLWDDPEEDEEPGGES